MRSRLEQALWQHPSVYVTEDQLAHLLGGTPDSWHARLKRAVKEGLLVRVRRGLYCLSEHLSLKRPHAFELAQLIYGPSYISLESALSYHHLIPEAVYSITSVTIKRNKVFKTPLGEFLYYRLPKENFFSEVTHIKEQDRQFFMASPWKSIFDYIFCYKKTWKDLTAIQESLRIELEDLPKINKKTLDQLSNFYHSKRISRFIKSIDKEFINEH